MKGGIEKTLKVIPPSKKGSEGGFSGSEGAATGMTIIRIQM